MGTRGFKTILTLGLLALSFVVAGSLIALAESSPAEQIKGVIEQVKQTMRDEKGKLAEDALDKKLRDIITPMFDFSEMSQKSLGAYWNKGTPEQQKEFVSLFSDLLANTYLKRIKKNAETSKINDIKEQLNADKAVVKSKVETDGDVVAIDYRLLLEEGKWKIWDVMIENVGLVTNYRNEFPEIVRKEGFEGLITRLKNKQIVGGDK